VYEDSGATQVNAVQANVNYDATKLSATLTASSAAGSPFNFPAEQTAGGGVVKVGEASLGSNVTGRQIVAKITFKVLATGTTSMSFDGASQIDEPVENSDGSSNSVDIWNHSTAAGSFTLAAAVVTPPPTSTGGSSTTTTPTKSSTSTTTKTSTPTQSTTPTTTTTPTPAATTPTTTATTPAATAAGVNVSITVLDAQHKPVSGATVALGGQTQKTDSTGKALFTGVSPSSYKVSVTAGGYHAVTTSLDVSSASDTAAQSISLKKTASVVPLITVVVCAVVVLGGASTGAVKLWQTHHFAGPKGVADAAASSIVVGGGGATNPGTMPYTPDVQPANTVQPALQPDASPDLVMHTDGALEPSAPAETQIAVPAEPAAVNTPVAPVSEPVPAPSEPVSMPSTGQPSAPTDGGTQLPPANTPSA